MRKHLVSIKYIDKANEKNMKFLKKSVVLENYKQRLFLNKTPNIENMGEIKWILGHQHSVDLEERKYSPHLSVPLLVRSI